MFVTLNHVTGEIEIIYLPFLPKFVWWILFCISFLSERSDGYSKSQLHKELSKYFANLCVICTPNSIIKVGDHLMWCTLFYVRWFFSPTNINCKIQIWNGSLEIQTCEPVDPDDGEGQDTDEDNQWPLISVSCHMISWWAILDGPCRINISQSQEWLAWHVM